MRVILVSLGSAIPNLVWVMLLLFCTFFLFALIGVQLWAGLFHGHCHMVLPPPAGVNLANLSLSSASIADVQAYVVNGTWRGAPVRCPDGSDPIAAEGPFTNDYGSILDGTNRTVTVHEKGWVCQDDVNTRLCALEYSKSDDCDKPMGYTTCVRAGGRQCALATRWDLNTQSGVTFDSVCRRVAYSDAPGWGFAGFDNIGFGLITIFTSVTMEGWVDNM